MLLGLLVETFGPERDTLVVGIDETLVKRWGKRTAAKGVYRDPVRSWDRACGTAPPTLENATQSLGLTATAVPSTLPEPFFARTPT